MSDLDLSEIFNDLTGRHASLLIRHAERQEISNRNVDHLAKLTEEGKKAAQSLGKTLGKRVASITSSSVPRCLDTAQEIVNGSGNKSMPINCDWRLGNPGVWVTDTGSSWNEFINYGIKGLIEMQMRGERINGYRDLRKGIELLLDLVLSESARVRNGVSVFVSHDAVIAPLVGYLLREGKAEDILPSYLEGILVTTLGGTGKFFWRGEWHEFLVKE